MTTPASKIADIVGVVDAIAFQTNILALNAAVEAARAGEHGRGFAVVASEVRNLAQRSSSASKEIAAQINNTVQRISTGSKDVEQAGGTMHEIVNAVQKVTDIMASIAAASAEQNNGIQQINQAIVDLDSVTQRNAAQVEEAAAAAETLRNQSNQLVEIIGTFKLE